MVKQSRWQQFLSWFKWGSRKAKPKPRVAKTKADSVDKAATKKGIASWFRRKPKLDQQNKQSPNFAQQKDIAKKIVAPKPGGRKTYWQVRTFFVVIILLVVAFILWACFFELDVTTMAPGIVMPSSRIKNIEHLEGGIIEQILVKEGHHVVKGEALVILESTASLSELRQLEQRIAASQIDIARLSAELTGADAISFSTDLEDNYPKFVAEAWSRFRERNEAYLNELKAGKEKIMQKDSEQQKLINRLKNDQQALKLIQSQVSISRDLLNQGISNRYTHLTLLREEQDLENRVNEDQGNLQKVHSELKEAQSNLQSYMSNHNDELRKELEEKARQLNEDQQKLARIADQFQRTTLYSPVDGVVSELNVAVPGEVVKPGETIMTVLPTGDKLIVQARLQVQQIGYVQVGQDALIRMASADAMRFDAIEGKVAYVSPDVFKDEATQETYYKVNVRTPTPYFTRGNTRYQLYPGMQVNVAIITGHRSVMSFLLDPVFGIYQTALQEK